MGSRKILLVSSFLILAAGAMAMSVASAKATQENPGNSRSSWLADGTDPLPTPPAEIADGTDPLPTPPLIADGTDPLPTPPAVA